MDFQDFLPNYPDVQDSQLQQKLLNKKEFFDFRIEAMTRQVESVPRDELQRHQRLIQRFLSPQTPYDELLIYHETGTGKTRAAFAATEHILLGTSTSFRKVIFLAKGKDQLENALAELVAYASETSRFKDIQPPEDREGNEMSIQTWIKRELSGSYEFRTWTTFTGEKGLLRLGDDQVLDQYNNTIFIVDEVHNIRGASTYREVSNVYTQLHRLFHLLSNRKILLMSGTPMRDQVNELADIFNLILPLGSQFPIGEAFNQRYISKPDSRIQNVDELQKKMEGRVSFLRAVPDEGVERVYMGEFLTPNLPVQQFKYFPTAMQPLQLEGYNQAYQLDTSVPGVDNVVNDADHAAGFYSNVRQATLFVFPDGSFGQMGYDRYRSSLRSFAYPLENLRKHSSKYAFIIEQLLRPDLRNQLTYVYCSLIVGSGLQLFADILKLYGFEESRGSEQTVGNRYIILTSSSKADAKDINKRIRYFNHERNANGEYCRVILGSRIISEGFTFKNVRQIHILTLHWNYTETQQAIARAIRYGSHRLLVASPSATLPVYIYQHAALNPETNDSIDLQMLLASQQKDILVRRMTRVIKEIAMDCPLVYARNRPIGRDSRECDYSSSCDYTCVQTESKFNLPISFDLNTYRLYYQESTDADVVTAIRQYFRESTGLPINIFALQDELELDWFQLVRVLSDMVHKNIPLVNVNNIECFLREDRDEYYLVDNLLLPNGNRHLSWYTHSPTILESQSLGTLIQKKGFPIYLQRIESLRGEFSNEVLNSLPVRLRELYKSLQQQKRQHGVQSEDDIFRRAVQRGSPYYGTVDQSEKFRIVDIRDASAEITDVRKLSSGAVCLEARYNKDRIVRVYFALGVPVEIPESYATLYPDPEAKLQSMKYGPELLTDPELQLDALRTEEQTEAYRTALYRIIRLLLMSKNDTCSTLREWMREHDLLAFIMSDVKGVRKGKLKEIRK